MGWASWNRFFCDYSEQDIRAQADALVSTGMRDLGYKYVLIQECIAPRRDAGGRLQPDPVRFPHGLRNLVDYIHARGLKAGIYTDVGAHTCFPGPLYEGSYNHEEQDAAAFAGWAFDLIEMDYCNLPAGHTGREIYERMARAIRKTGRPMLFYICSWGNESPWLWAYGKAQLWRTEADISLERNRAEWNNIVQRFESNATHSVFSAPNSWNDPDMLEAGNPGLDLTEARTHVSMWAISSAPLWVGTDLVQMSDEIRALYTNPEMIAVDQDPLGAGPERVREDAAGIEIWKKTLADAASGVSAVLLLNLSSAPADVSVAWRDLGLTGSASVRDLWRHADLGRFAEAYTARIPAHGSVLLKVTGEFQWDRGITYEAEWPGNRRGPGASVTACPECSRGYAIKLPAHATGSTDSSIQFSHILAPQAGPYTLTVAYAENGLAETTVEMAVNGGKPVELPLKNLIHGEAVVTVQLQAGENSILFRNTAHRNVVLDRIRILRKSSSRLETR
jgi:alpha-galactosidase